MKLKSFLHNFIALNLALLLLYVYRSEGKLKKKFLRVSECSIIITNYLKTVTERKKIFYFNYNCV
jgi:hypothetical protein